MEEREMSANVHIEEWMFEGDDGYDLLDALDWLAGLETKRCPKDERIHEAAVIGQRFAEAIRAAMPCPRCKGLRFINVFESHPMGGNVTAHPCPVCAALEPGDNR